jgi:hypothetical protein
MKITLTWSPTGTTQPTNFILADSPAAIPLSNFRINGSRNIQEAQFFRATARQFYDRGNRKTEVTFDTTRLFADQVTAESFILMHETQFPGQFLVTFVAGVSGGSATASRYLQNAVVESLSSAISGCTTKHSYRITGGVMTTNPN